MYQFWESTKNYRDTGEMVGFVSFQEGLSPPEENVEDKEQDGGVDGQAGDDGEERGRGKRASAAKFHHRRVLSFASLFALYRPLQVVRNCDTLHFLPSLSRTGVNSADYDWFDHYWIYVSFC